jgi:hypothetical protein
MASDTDSESEFEGFNEEKVQLAIDKDRIIQARVQELLNNESDIDISDEESEDSSESSDEEDVYT